VIAGRDPLGRPGADPDVRQLLALAAPDVTAPVVVDADLHRGRVALGRRRSLLATLAVGAGTALVAAAAVLVPQGLAGVVGSGGVPASGTLTSGPDTGGAADDRPDDPPQPPPTASGEAPADGAVPLVPGPEQHPDDVVATLVPQGWRVLSADERSLSLSDPGGEQTLLVGPAPHADQPPVLGGVGDFERVDRARASYYLVDASGGAARPTMVLQLRPGAWTQVSASPSLGWGMPELTAFTTGLRAPFTCADPCEVPLAP
jgi:hypothetical protein